MTNSIDGLPANQPLFRAAAPLVLASASPRRKQFFQDMGLDFQVHPAAIDETPLPGEQPADFARRMAENKAVAVARRFPGAFVIGADTIVCVDDTILGKPADPDQALAMLTRLVNRAHRVISGLAIHCRERKIREIVTQTTTVVFADYPEAVLAAYVRTGEPLDKAGSYGIQGLGAFLVREIRGSCANVIGLPVQELVRILLRYEAIVCSPGP